MQKEAEFIQQLEERARKQRGLLATEILPTWARGVAMWLAVNPWRVLIPTAILLYLLMRLVGGELVRELVLAIFGGFS